MPADGRWDLTGVYRLKNIKINLVCRIVTHTHTHTHTYIYIYIYIYIYGFQRRVNQAVVYTCLHLLV
jgi:hypothetical protein